VQRDSLGQKIRHVSDRFPSEHQKTLFVVMLIKHWHRFPREIVESPSFQIFKSHVNMVLENFHPAYVVEAGGQG